MYSRNRAERKVTIFTVTAAAFQTISVISSTILKYEDHFKRNH